MRALRECTRLLPRGAGLLMALASPAAAGGGALAAAAVAAPSMQPAVLREAAALRRWVHSGACRSAWQRHAAQQWQQQQQQQWARLEPGGAARQLWLRRWMSDKPRTAKDLYAAANKKNTDQGWHIVSLGGGLGGLASCGAAETRWAMSGCCCHQPAPPDVECLALPTPSGSWRRPWP